MKTVYDYPKTWDKKLIKKEVRKKFPNFKLNKIEIQPANDCQFNCPWCYGKNLKPEPTSEVSIRDYEENVFKPVRKYKPIIMVAGLYSEPLLYPRIIDIFRMIGKYKFKFGLYTNGQELTEEMSKVILENSDSRSHISINVSASELHHQPILDKVEMFAKLRKKINPKFQINVPILLDGAVIVGTRLAHQDKLLRLGVDNIRYSVPLRPVDLNNHVEYLKKVAPKNIHIPEKSYDKCYAMLNSLSISPEGYVFPCSQTTTIELKRFIIGSVREEKITDIWDRRFKFWDKFNPKCEICRCNPVEHKFNELCGSYK